MAQEFPMKKWLGEWEVEFYKTEPEGLIGTPGYPKTISFSYTLTEDGRGLLQTNKWVDNGQEIMGTACIFHNPEKNESYALSSVGRAVTTYPDSATVVVKGYTFEGKLVSVQNLTIISEEEFDGWMEFYEGDKTIKVWGLSKRKE